MTHFLIRVGNEGLFKRAIPITAVLIFTMQLERDQ